MKKGTPSQILAMRTVHRARWGSSSQSIGWWTSPMSRRIWLTAPPSSWKRNLKMTPGDEQRQQPGDDDERASQRPPREPEGKQQGEGKADYELADERPEGELESMDDGVPAGGVVKDEAVICQPGERSREVADRRDRGLLEAEHHVVDDRQEECEQQVQEWPGSGTASPPAVCGVRPRAGAPLVPPRRAHPGGLAPRTASAPGGPSLPSRWPEPSKPPLWLRRRLPSAAPS